MRLSGQREGGGGGRGRGGRRLRSRAYGMDEGNQGHREAIGEERGRVGDALAVLATAANSSIDAVGRHARDSRVNVSTLGTTGLQRLSQAHAALDVRTTGADSRG